MTTILENRRARVLRLINLATQDGNAIKMFQGYDLLTEIYKRLASAYATQGRFSNLY